MKVVLIPNDNDLCMNCITLLEENDDEKSLNS